MTLLQILFSSSYWWQGLWAQGFGKTEPKWQFMGKKWDFFAQYADDAH